MDEQKSVEKQSVLEGTWINALIKATPKGYSIWIPKGAFKDVEMATEPTGA